MIIGLAHLLRGADVMHTAIGDPWRDGNDPSAREMSGGPDRIRTCGLPLRRRSLYPAELRGLIVSSIAYAIGIRNANLPHALAIRTSTVGSIGGSTLCHPIPRTKLMFLSIQVQTKTLSG